MGASSAGPNIQNEKRKKDSSSESEEDEDAQQILLKKKMLIMQSNNGSEEADDNNLPKKDMEAPLSSLTEQNKIASVDLQTESAPRMEVDTDEVISPKKKPKVISSDSEGEEDKKIHDPVGDKLTELGRKNADRKKLKRKIEIESKLKGMKALHEEKLQNQNLKRSSRIRHRKDKKESQSES